MNALEVASFAKELASSERSKRYFIFGAVGVGKTYFVSSFIKAIDESVRVKSPTYSYVNEYESKKGKIVHIDAYRLSGYKELESIGFFEYLKEDIYLFVEWSDNIENYIPKNSNLIYMKYLDLDRRSIDLKCIS
jgi:tRNA threonylcarbamoyladenosine biosynthesis protein TsaE